VWQAAKVKSKITTPMILRRDLILFPPGFFPLDTAGELKVEKYCNLLNGVVKFFSSFWDENYAFYREKKEVGFVR